MRTIEDEGKFSHFALHRNEIIERRHHEETNFNNNANEERIMATYRPKEKTYYFDNSAISMSFGQNNLEKCLVVMFIIITYSTCLIYNYYQYMDLFGIIFISTGEALDGIIIMFYIFFLLKLRNDSIFNRIPISVMNIADVFIIIDFIVKIATFIMILFSYNVIETLTIVLFTLKFFLELYFVLISIKMFLSSPCSIYVREQTEKFWNLIRYYIFCAEIEEDFSVEYTKIEDLDSFY